MEDLPPCNETEIPGFRLVFRKGKWKHQCKLCDGRPCDRGKNVEGHLGGDRHTRKLAELNEFQNGYVNRNRINPYTSNLGINDPTHMDLDSDRSSSEENSIQDHDFPLPQPEMELDESPHDEFSDPGSLVEQGLDDDHDVNVDWNQWFLAGIQSCMQDNEQSAQGEEGNDQEVDESKEMDVDPLGFWYPFPKKEYLIACLMLGNLRTMMSRAMYNQNRLILSTICNLDLPHWDTIRRTRLRIRKLFSVNVAESQTVLDNRCFTLSIKHILQHEISNPLVNTHLQFYPHDTRGRYIHALYQSTKWREELSPQHLVVPIFFFKTDMGYFAKCIVPKYSHSDDPKADFNISIPGNINYNSPDLFIVPASDFYKAYYEIKLEGVPFHKKCNGRIHG
ncbi:hypothetical protein PSTG_01855 [Puccinia striiformis f. sp. tritici PST-78]|uniref:Uncharacterized protein n=1 Tax=Puccinia striiformis f. sp. tritici PST-78 TaxID=1165861 RepID=A0A0L0VZU5_9BASI|nr:hypothetical protein PSTG_01855 [Puccinia striiformis f. sp. tritici PST-78]